MAPEGCLVAGKYRIVRLVAAGSMGEVHEARHVGIGKRVAVKVMPPHLASSAERIARFRREARAAGMLESDHIVQVFDAGCDDALGPYLVTELLVGEDLEQRLARERRLDPAIAAAIGYEVALGLAKAHAAGVIHRDLKPANVFLAERDDGVRVAKILDFGISKTTLDEALSADGCVTAAGVTMGTPEYMSPEQAQGLPDLDGRSDLFSLGATLYEALCGHPPHERGRTPLELMLRIAREDAPPLSSIAPWVPRALRAIVHEALHRDREERTPDAATLARALKAAVPEARWSLRGIHPEIRLSEALSEEEPPPTLPSPPPVMDLPEEESPPPSGGTRVQFFRRDTGGVPVVARRQIP